MSFTSDVKNEVSSLETLDTENITELSALLRNIGTIDKDSIKVTSENINVASRIQNLLKNVYGIIPKITVRKGYNFNKKYLYLIEIIQKIEMITNDMDLNSNIPSEYIYDDDDLLRAYLRGLFLSVGSVNDPKKSRYHLEFLVDNLEYANFLNEILSRFYLNSKVLKRENKYMIYVKEAEKIGDFLRIINASEAVMYYEDIRIYRDHVNMTNRLNNCEQANVEKTMNAASEQIKDIELLEKTDVFDLLDEKVKEAALYRKKYPEVSLSELSEIISLETGKSITKSGLNHRMNKIKNLANKLKK